MTATTFALGSFAYASPFMMPVYLVDTSRATYTGTVTQYSTLANALSQTSPVSGPTTIGNRKPTYNGGSVTPVAFQTSYRDLQIFMAHGVEQIVPGNPPFNNATYFLTDWYQPNNVDNPNDTNDGFIQYYDDPATFDVITEAGWDNLVGSIYTSMTLHVSGANAQNGTTRSWTGALGTSPNGKFDVWDYNVTYNGLNGIEIDPVRHYIEATNQPTSASGTFNGVFETGGSFFRFDYTVSLTNSWLFGDPANTGQMPSSYFFGQVPEPAAATLILLSAPITLFARHRHQRAA